MSDKKKNRRSVGRQPLSVDEPTARASVSMPESMLERVKLAAKDHGGVSNYLRELAEKDLGKRARDERKTG